MVLIGVVGAGCHRSNLYLVLALLLSIPERMLRQQGHLFPYVLGSRGQPSELHEPESQVHSNLPLCFMSKSSFLHNLTVSNKFGEIQPTIAFESNPEALPKFLFVDADYSSVCFAGDKNISASNLIEPSISGG